MRSTRVRLLAPIPMLLMLAAWSGCAFNKQYRILSDPPGATVRSGDVVYGTTPFETDLNTILPFRMWDAKPGASRKLVFEKEGYLPGTAVISEFGDAGDVRVDLQPAEPSAPPESSGTGTCEGSAEERLVELERLRRKRLIDAREYELKRDEVLDCL